MSTNRAREDSIVGFLFVVGLLVATAFIFWVTDRPAPDLPIQDPAPVPKSMERSFNVYQPDTVVASPTPATPKPQPVPQPAKAEQGSSAPTVSPVAHGSVWDELAQCESGGNWQINTGNGYYGGLQFSLSSWQGVGGSGSPSNASRSEQIYRAEILLKKQGWGAWPSCSAQLGLG